MRFLIVCLLCPSIAAAFHVPSHVASLNKQLYAQERDAEDVSSTVLESLSEKLEENAGKDVETKKKDNSSMAFLRRMGKVGGAANKNFVNAVGSDEGSTGRQPPAERKGATTMPKSKQAYVECTKSGIIDDLSEAFPITSCGTQWRGISDRVMGGVSNGKLERKEDVKGRVANCLTGEVSLENNGGFLQLVTDLALDPAKANEGVDASDYDGIELDVLSRNEKIGDYENGGEKDDGDNMFRPQKVNVHVRTPGTFNQSSFRYTCIIDEPDTWTKIRIPFSSFEGHGPGAVGEKLNVSALRRVGIVAIGEQMKVDVAVGGLRFYSVI